MSRTIAFLNRKGGVGKTSTVHHLSGELAALSPGNRPAERGHARKALNLLGQAVKQGFRNVELLKRDVGFRSMWERPDFKDLVHDLEVKWKGGCR